MTTRSTIALALLVVACGSWGGWRMRAPRPAAALDHERAAPASVSVAPRDALGAPSAPATNSPVVASNDAAGVAPEEPQAPPMAAAAPLREETPAPGVVIRWAGADGAGKPSLSRFLLRVDGRRGPPSSPGAYVPVYLDPARWVVGELRPGRHLIWFVAPETGAPGAELRGQLLDVEAPSEGMPTRTIQFAGRPVASLGVAVADADTGKPVKGATVELRWEGRLLQVETTNEYGAATCLAPSDRSVTLDIKADGYAPDHLDAKAYDAGIHRLEAIALLSRK